MKRDPFGLEKEYAYLRRRIEGEGQLPTMRGDSISTSLEDYLKSVDLKKLLMKLDVQNVDFLLKEAEHFTKKEAEKRDAILLSYFGEAGINRITDLIVEFLQSQPLLKGDAKILDVGAGSGMITVGVAKKLRSQTPLASFYALDLTPSMLQLIAEKTNEITPFLGVVEDITGSVKHAKEPLGIPTRFDAAFSTLVLHHSLNPEKVFASMEKALKKGGKAVIIDLCKHDFEEFRNEMGDVHLGFEPKSIESMARRCFRWVRTEVICGVCCQSTGRSVGLFAVLMRKI